MSMTSYDFASILLLILAIATNSTLVYLQKTRNVYKRFGQRAYGMHGILISLLWGVFIISEFVNNRSTWRFSHGYPTFGFAVMAAALALFGLAIQQIGWTALGNGYFFGKPLRKLGGVYKYVPEPIYWSYAIWFAGIGFVTSLKVFFVFTIISIVGLVGIESWVERPTERK